jgi:hypothetical protein
MTAAGECWLVSKISRQKWCAKIQKPKRRANENKKFLGKMPLFYASL